jgi:hypothetical protein
VSLGAQNRLELGQVSLKDRASSLEEQKAPQLAAP